jgi:hypothetical protein
MAVAEAKNETDVSGDLLHLVDGGSWWRETFFDREECFPGFAIAAALGGASVALIITFAALVRYIFFEKMATTGE